MILDRYSALYDSIAIIISDFFSNIADYRTHQNELQRFQPSPPLPRLPPQEAAKMSSSTFAPFSRLPEELRLRIWETATTAIGPRVIIVEERGRDCSEERFEGNGYRNNNPLTFPTYHTSCASGVPAVLHATRESRAVAMEQYKLSFRTVDGRPKW